MLQFLPPVQSFRLERTFSDRTLTSKAPLSSRRRYTSGWSGCPMEELADGGPEVAAVVAVDEWIDAAVGGAQPLSDGGEVLPYERPLVSRHGGPKEVPQDDDVQWKPGQREEDDDNDEHLQDFGLRSEDVAFGAGTEETADPATPDADPDEKAEDGDEGEGDEVAGEEDDCDGEGLRRPGVGPVGVAGDVVVAGDEECLLVVDEDPGNEGQGRNEPDEEDDESGATGSHLRSLVREYRKVSAKETDGKLGNSWVKDGRVKV